MAMDRKKLFPSKKISQGNDIPVTLFFFFPPLKTLPFPQSYLFDHMNRLPMLTLRLSRSEKNYSKHFASPVAGVVYKDDS